MHRRNLDTVFSNVISSRQPLKGEEGTAKKTAYCLENYPQRIHLLIHVHGHNLQSQTVTLDFSKSVEWISFSSFLLLPSYMSSA